jgi:FtsP/CotA-like multicopper oxidase with cupredoxin domain
MSGLEGEAEMRDGTKRRLPRILTILTAALVTVIAAGGSGGQVISGTPIDLCATTGSVSLPGSADPVPIWGFVAKGAADDCSDVANTATLPNPVLEAAEGDTVTINVTNALPGRTISFEVPGLDFMAGPTDAATGETVSRTFVASAPGTYLYQSVGDAERQTAMGMYGALLVRPGAANQAYDDAASAYDVEATLVLSAVDPAFNAAPDAFDMKDYHATAWLINGKAYPDTDPIVAAAGQDVLLRYLNAGYDNTTMMLLGMHEHVIARDAYELGNPVDANAETIPAGGTEDAIATVPATSSGLPNGFPLYNRQLHLTNGDPGASPGGMLTFIEAP